MGNNITMTTEKTKNKKFIILIGIIVWMTIGTIISVYTEKIYGFTESEIFSDQEQIIEIYTSDIVNINDVETDGDGYVIVGEDAYVVYYLETASYIRALRVEFSEEFEKGISIQIFYAGEDAIFSEDDSVTVDIGSDTYSEVLIETDDICYIRIDVDAEEGTEYEITKVYADVYNTFVVNPLINPFFWEYVVLTLFCVVTYALNRKYQFMARNRVRYSFIILGGWVAMLVFTYSFLLAGEYTISMSNFMYSIEPWSVSNTAVAGPTLSDAIDSFLPSIYETYYGSGFSFWENRIGFGVAVGIQTIMYPFNWFYFLPLKYAIILKSMFEYSVAYFSMCYLLKRLKLSSVSQMLGGVSYAMSSAMVMWHFWAHTDVMMLAPLILGLGNKIVEERKLKDMFLMAIVEYLMLIAGMPTFAAYVIYLLGFYVLFMPIAKYRKDIKKIFHVYFIFAGAIILGVLCAMPYLQTLLSTVGSNGYLEIRSNLGTVTLSWDYLRTVILPYLRTGMSMAIPEATIYCGIVSLVFLAFVCIRYRCKKQNFWVISWAVIMVLVFTHYLDFIYLQMPEINTSVKARIIAVLVLVTVVLAMISFDDIIKNIDVYKKQWTRYIAYAVVLVVTGALFYCYPDNAWSRNSFLAVILLIILTELIIRGNKYFVKAACFGIAAVAVINMSAFAYRYMPLIDADADIIPDATDSIEFLQENTDDERIYIVGEWAMFPNTNVFYDLTSLSSHSLINSNADIAAYYSAVDDEMYDSATNYHGSKVDSYALLSYAGVKYIVLAPTYTDAVIDEAELVYEGNDGLEIYEIEGYNERFFLSTQVIYADSYDEVLESMEEEYIQNAVFIVGDDDGQNWLNEELTESETIEVLEDEGDYVMLSVYSDGTRMLVFNEYDDGNWTVYVDGEEAEIETVNYLFKGVCIDAGDHTIEFVYEDSSLNVFIIVAIVTAIVILCGLIVTAAVPYIKRRRAVSC